VAQSEAQASRMYQILCDSRVSIDSSEVLNPADERSTAPAPDADGAMASEARAGNVLMQEFVEGDEWVVDMVSRDGEHKALALWKYDKREANGAPFVYFSDEVRGAEGETEAKLIAYAAAALDALQWRWGPVHIELKACPTGEVKLVEVNAGRWNGVDFKMLADVCTGFNAYDATLDAYVDEQAWDAVPSAPPAQLRGHGRLVKLVSSVSGTLAGLCAEATDEISNLPSLVLFEPAAEVGERIEQTIDLRTCAGYAHLLHGDEEVIQADYARIQALQPELFLVERDS